VAKMLYFLEFRLGTTLAIKNKELRTAVRECRHFIFIKIELHTARKLKKQ
jgi:hypothetical protein